MKHNYKSILDKVREEIERRSIQSGELMPTETELAVKYNVSRPTITKVYDTLQDEKYVTKKKGVGTRVIYKELQKNSTYGLLLPGSGESEIFSIINDRLLERSREGKFHCLWEGATAGNAEIRKELTEIYADSYISKSVDGVLFAPLERIPHADDINRKICEKFAKANIPLVLIDRDIVDFPARSQFDLVSLDNFNAGYTMAEHLLDAKCAKINFVYRPGSASSVTLRRLGAAAAVLKRGLNFDNGNIYCGNPEDEEFVRTIGIVNGQTGIICANDSTAAVLMSTMDAMGIKISEDLLICGYDNMKYAEHLKYPLTSYSQPCENIADMAIELLERRLRNRNMTPNQVTLLGEMVPRRSSVFSK